MLGISRKLQEKGRFVYTYVCISIFFTFFPCCFAETLNFDRPHLTRKCYFKVIFKVVYFIQKMENVKFVDP